MKTYEMKSVLGGIENERESASANVVEMSAEREVWNVGGRVVSCHRLL